MRSDLQLRLYFAVGLLAANLAGVIGLGVFGMSVLSSLRAFVGGEGLWAKAQKDALHRLERYNRDRREEDYGAFLEHLKIPLGDKQARLSLERRPPDYGAADAGFIAGGNHPADVRGMGRLFVHFRRVSYMAKAITYWEQGDLLIAELQQEAGRLRHARTPAATRLATERLLALDKRLTRLEVQFSAVLGEASRWALRVFCLIMITGTGLFGGLSLFAAALVGGRIATGIRALSQAAARAGQGDLSVRVPAGERDELGRLGEDFNRMQEGLAAKTRELEAFSYSVAHDLRAPLGKIQGYGRILEGAACEGLNAEGRDSLRRLLNAGRRMEEIIDGLLMLSRLSRQELKLQHIDFSALTRQEAEDLRAVEPQRSVAVTVAPGLEATADLAFTRIIMQNLLKNAWKFTSQNPHSHVEVGGERRDGEDVFWVRDDGAGFDMAHAAKLFEPFSRLHTLSEFPGSGIGLATVRRAVERHGGRIWAEGAPGKGAVFSFTLRSKEGGVC